MALPLDSEARPEGAGANLVPVGEQITGFEEPDLIYMKLSGTVTEDEVRVINEMQIDFSRGRERVFFLVDLSELESLSNSVRRAAIEALNKMPVGGLAVYDAPLTARVLAKLLVTGMRLFGKYLPLQFLDSEAEARAWIEQQRQA
ncbi:MAG: STAS/SEC14 domain-containing protein [Thermoanaerobaculia bacterium]